MTPKNSALLTIALGTFVSTACASTIFRDEFIDPQLTNWVWLIGNATKTNLNQQFLLSARCGRMDTNNIMATHFAYGRTIQVPEPLANDWTLEGRADLISASETNAWADVHYLWNKLGGAGHLLWKDSDELYLVKWWNGGARMALFLEERLPLKNTNVTLVLGLTRRDSNLEMNVRVLDNDEGNAVLYQRTVTDTPNADPVILNRVGAGPDMLGEAWHLIGGSGYFELCLDWADQDHGPANGMAQITYDNAEVNLCPSPRPYVVAWDQSGGGNSASPYLTNVVAVASGGCHNLALRANGTLAQWDSSGKEYANGLSNVVAITASAVGIGPFPSRCHFLALRADGTVVDWDDLIEVYHERAVPSGLSNVVAVAAGTHSLALRADGTVVAWGDYEQSATNVPPGLSNVVAVAANSLQSLVLRADGTVLAWGDSATNVPSGLSNVVAVAADVGDSLFLRQDGTVFGYDYDGRTNDIPPGATNAVAIAVGLWHSLALRADGTVVSWGGLGGVATNVPVGLKNAIAIDAGAGFDVALIGNGSPMVRAPLSYPILDANGFSVSIPTQSGRVYRLEYKASWADANWAALPLVAGTGKEVTLTDPTVSGTQRFFRVRRW